MKTADQVAAIIEQVKHDMAHGLLTASLAAWKAALACNEWAYVYGAYGEYCDPSNRRSRASTKHPKIKEKCKNFNGNDNIPAGCVGCKWFLGTAESDQKVHAGRTRFFDCRGFVYWILHQVLGMWDKCPAGATTMWKKESNWKAKGLVKEGVPKDVLVCLFYPSADDPGKMAHVGFGYNGETVECSSGVEYHPSYDKKWTHWAVPACIDGEIPTPEPPDPDKKPTLRKGDSGPYVTLAQTELLQRGYDLGSWGADGKFGAQTEKAVKQFQTDWGLTADGIIGPKTWDMLDSTPVKVLYTANVPHLSLAEAEKIAAQYPGTTIIKEDGDA